MCTSWLAVIMVCSKERSINMKKMHEKLEMLRKHFIQKVDLPTNRAAYPKSWTGPWTLDSGLWTLDSGFFLSKLYPQPKKNLYLPPEKPPYPPHETPPSPINISSPKYSVRVFKQTRYSPHPPPRKNLYVSPLKLPPPPKKPPSPPPNKKYNYTGLD